MLDHYPLEEWMKCLSVFLGLYFLTKIGLITPNFMRIYRRHAMVLILILSAIITPPDIISQVLVSLPLGKTPQVKFNYYKVVMVWHE